MPARTRNHLMRIVAIAVVAAVSAGLVSACGSSRTETLELRGATMGTQYGVQVVGLPEGIDRGRLAGEIESELASVNALMSTYDEDSELSRFNRYEGTDWFAVSAQTAAVVRQAQAIGGLTGGAFDVTVGPLVNLWGFGPDARRDPVPAADAIADAAERVGQEMIEVRDAPPSLRKSRPDIYVDLSAIAKGHGVDQIAAILEAKGVGNYLVDIGGEVRLSGKNARGGPWRLAVEDPLSVAREPMEVIELTDAAVATSGNYRNYFEHEGVRYAHTIDPRTGWPVKHGLLSVTVVAEDTMTADAWATALMVLGAEEGKRLAERLGLAVIFLTEGGEGVIRTSTTAMDQLTASSG